MYIYEVASESSRNSMVKFTGIATVNTEMYTSVLRRVRDEVRKKRPEKWRTKSLFLLHHNAPAHRSVLVKDFLARNNVTKLQHPPYSPDLPPPDFYLFPGLKPALKDGAFVMLLT